MSQVLFSFDTEDFVTPESDDALKLIAQTLTRRGIRASFAMVGDKARALVTRGRKDVVDVLRAHDIQYHANTHLQWPNTPVFLSKMTWDEGVDFVIASERHGVEDVAEIFDQRPRAWIRCGGNWAPGLIYGLRLLGIEHHVPSIYLLPGQRPVWMLNVLHGRYSGSIERYFKPELTVADMHRELREAREKAAGSTLPLALAAHPCMFATTTFYDTHNMRAKGVYPGKEKWVPAPLLPPGELRRRIHVLDEIAKFVRTWKGLEIVTHSDVIDAHREPARWVTAAQLLRLARGVRANFDYQKLGDGYLSAADVFGLLSLALTRWAVAGAMPPRLAVRRLIGPPEPTPPLRRTQTLSREALIEGCRQVEREIDVRHRLPSCLRLDGRRVHPSSFLMAMADAVLAIAAGRAVRVALAPAPEYPAIKDVVFANVRCGASQLPASFTPGRIIPHTHQQTWTARPAVLAST